MCTNRRCGPHFRVPERERKFLHPLHFKLLQTYFSARRFPPPSLRLGLDEPVSHTGVVLANPCPYDLPFSLTNSPLSNNFTTLSAPFCNKTASTHNRSREQSMGNIMSTSSAPDQKQIQKLTELKNTSLSGRSMNGGGTKFAVNFVEGGSVHSQYVGSPLGTHTHKSSVANKSMSSMHINSNPLFTTDPP